MNREKLIVKYCKDKKILDVGCSDCELKNYAEAKEYTGIDIIPEKGIVGNIEDYQLNKKFDVVVALGCFHQIHNIGLALRNINHHTKGGGLLIVGVPYVFAWKYRIFGNRLLDYNAIRWYCKYTLENLLEMYGFEIFEIKILNKIRNPELFVIARRQ